MATKEIAPALSAHVLDALADPKYLQVLILAILGAALIRGLFELRDQQVQIRSFRYGLRRLARKH